MPRLSLVLPPAADRRVLPWRLSSHSAAAHRGVGTLYGGCALLIREITRRTGRGWPTILMLALAFGVLEEAAHPVTVNPDYLGAHLLDVFVPSLGIAIPWTIFVLTLHTVCSISTPIAIVEESTFRRRTTPWLGTLGCIVTMLLFVAGSFFAFAFSYSQDNDFMASPTQLVISAVIVAVLVVIALRLPPVAATGQRDGRVADHMVSSGSAPGRATWFSDGTIVGLRKCAH